MAVMPNGLRAAPEYLGSLIPKELAVVSGLLGYSNFSYIKHVRQCLNAIRCGARLRVSSSPLPESHEDMTGEDWAQVWGAWTEYRRTLYESRVVLDFDHVAWCLDQLLHHKVFESDPEIKFRPLEAQLEYFFEYDRVLRGAIAVKDRYIQISEGEFEVVNKAIESGVLREGDLLLYCHQGNPLLTADLARAYINCYAGGIYRSDEPTLYAGDVPTHILSRTVFEPGSSKRFQRPNGFYVKRLPYFSGDRRFATSNDFVDYQAAEKAAEERWPMSCEAFQIFGVTHKCYSDLRRPAQLLLPGFCLKEFDLCHCGGEGWDVGRQTYTHRNVNMLSIDTRISLVLGSLCRRTELTDEKAASRVGFGFLDPWTPYDKRSCSETSCGSCRNLVFQYEGFTICSFCGAVS